MHGHTPQYVQSDVDGEIEWLEKRVQELGCSTVREMTKVVMPGHRGSGSILAKINMFSRG